jgi:hypothetical protein
MDFRKIASRLLLGENKSPSMASYSQTISEILESITPRSKTDSLRIETAKASLKEVRRRSRRLQEKVTLLEEQVQVLEESK